MEEAGSSSSGMSPLDQQIQSLKTRPYTRRQCKCPYCLSGEKIVGPSGRRLHYCDWPGCERIFDDASRLAIHLRRHTGQREFFCGWPGCNRQFFQKDHLKTHIEHHTGMDLVCKVCNFKAQSKTELGNHQVTYHEKLKVKCECPNCMAPVGQKIVGPDGRKLHTCKYEDCGRIFDATSKLQIHLQRHIGEKSFACLWENCDRKFYRKDHLKEHMLYHTGQNGFMCRVCGCRFSWKKGLQSHMRTVHNTESSPENQGKNIPERVISTPNVTLKESEPVPTVVRTMYHNNQQRLRYLEHQRQLQTQEPPPMQSPELPSWDDYFNLLKQYSERLLRARAQGMTPQQQQTPKPLYRHW